MELERTGVVQLPLAAPDLPDASALLRAGQRLVTDHAAALSSAATRSDFVLVPPDALLHTPEVYRFGLDERVLDLVEDYLGEPVGYDGVTIQYTPADGREASTRVWHSDREDRRMIKVIIYLNDVFEDDGPFELFPMERDRLDHDRLRNSYVLSPSDKDELIDRNPDAKVVSCMGAAGTAILADTARFYHRGRPAVRSARAAIFFSYFSARPKHPYYCNRTGLSPLQLKTLLHGLNRRQREAALWRQRLPLGWRLIPSAPL